MFNKFKNMIYHNIIGESILFTIGLCLMIIAVFYNVNNFSLTLPQQVVFTVALAFFAGALVFMFLIIYQCIRITKLKKLEESPTKEHSDYDVETGLLYPDVFYKKIQEYLLLSSAPACLVLFHAENIEQLYRTQFPNDEHSQIYSFSSILIPTKQDNHISAIKSRHEYLVFLYGKDKESMLHTIDTMHTNLKTELAKLIPSITDHIIECGYTWYPTQSKSLEDLITNTSFAVFESICFNKEEKNEFAPSSYQKQKQEFKRNDRFEKLMDTNCFIYHFQPIISAKTGDVYAYEALMRTEESIGLNPAEILEIADRQGKLYDIEYYTFFNILKIYKEQFESFHNKYLFINCLPNQLLTKEDFDNLYKKYNVLSEHLVVEASEIYVHTEEEHLLLTERLYTLGAKLALDDYGSGYANELNLVKYNPRYIKIDRSLITDIDSDEKKRHLVSNIIQFAKLHSMISLAEGVETYKELQTVIFLGVDLLQGFYLQRPTLEVMKELTQKQRDEIAAINLKYLKHKASSDTYITDKDTELTVAGLSLDNYNEVIVNVNELKLIGDPNDQQILSITVPDNSKLFLELENVNIRGKNGPCINIGRNCQITIKLTGNNILSSQGIRVPESSKLLMIGDGNLSITTDCSNNIGIGESHFQTYGSIRIDIQGTLAIRSKRESSICIGGGKGSPHSKIELVNGQYSLAADGEIGVGIGCLEGQANIELGRIYLTIMVNGNNSIGIGSLNGSLNLASSADIAMKLTGVRSCCIGVLSNQKGNILLQEGFIKLKLNARTGCAIGSIDGALYIKLSPQEIFCLIQGNNICGIGNYTGSGITEIKRGAITVKILANNKMYLGSQNGPLLINGGNINCPINSTVKPINKYRIPLRHYRFTDCKTFSEHVEIDNLAYDYVAYTTENIHDINVYLPELREYEQFLCE